MIYAAATWMSRSVVSSFDIEGSGARRGLRGSRRLLPGSPGAAPVPSRASGDGKVASTYWRHDDGEFLDREARWDFDETKPTWNIHVFWQ
jgi:hypothetical protein